jgi:hypothetical protein
MMTDELTSILRALVILRPVTPGEFEDLHPHLGDAKANLQSLGKLGYLDSTYRPSLAMLWEINSKGRRYLAQIDAAGGQIAGPRNGIPEGRYTGEKRTHTRPGSDDFLKLPSRRGDSTVEWERPFIISGRVEPVGVRG